MVRGMRSSSFGSYWPHLLLLLPPAPAPVDLTIFEFALKPKVDHSPDSRHFNYGDDDLGHPFASGGFARPSGG